MKTKSCESPFVHHMSARVYYGDTDAAGVVYYANYLRFAEAGRMEFLRALGYDHNAVCREHSMVLAVRRVEVDYRASACLDDLLDIATEVQACQNSSMTMRQVIRRGEDVLAELIVVIVAVGSSGRAVRLPPQLRQISDKNCSFR